MKARASFRPDASSPESATDPALSLRYSVVAPMHDEQGNVSALYEDIKKTMEQLGESYEIIFVNDASRDETLAKMRSIRNSDSHFHFVDLENNVGENWALLAGISKAQGRVIITIDGDYQNDPSYIPDLLRELSNGYRVVSGRRKDRSAGFWTKRLPSQIANGMIRVVSGVPVHDCGCGLKVYRREVLEGKFVPAGFMNRFSPVSLGIKKNEFAEVEILDRPRNSGESHYGLGRVFIVLRDLCVIPFALGDPTAWRVRFGFLTAMLAVGALVAGITHRWLFTGLLGFFSFLSLSNFTKLGRFIEAQREPQFRIKEYR